jgi:hypothetical protein
MFYSQRFGCGCFTGRPYPPSPSPTAASCVLVNHVVNYSMSNLAVNLRAHLAALQEQNTLLRRRLLQQDATGSTATVTSTWIVQVIAAIANRYDPSYPFVDTKVGSNSSTRKTSRVTPTLFPHTLAPVFHHLGPRL